MTHHCLAQDGRLCARCTYALGDTLRNIPDLYLRLEVEIVRATPPPSVRPATREAPMPVSAADLDLLTLNVRYGDGHLGIETVESWCRIVLEERQLVWPTPMETVFGRLHLACRFLLIHLGWVSEQAWVDELQSEVRAIERGLRNAVAPDERRFVGTQIPCVTEGCKGKFAIDFFDPGARALLCRTCEARWEPEAFELLGQQVGIPVLPADVAGLTGINEKTIRTWIQRGQIPNHGKPGAPRVLLSDCLNAWKAKVA